MINFGVYICWYNSNSVDYFLVYIIPQKKDLGYGLVKFHEEC